MKNKLIEIHDEIIPVHIQDDVENLVYGKNYNIDFKYTRMDNITRPSNEFSIHDYGFTHILRHNLMNTIDEFDDYFSQILHCFCLYKKLKLVKYINGRVFYQPPSLDPGPLEPHIDMEKSDPETGKISFIKHLVMLYYINDADGDTLFFDEDKKEIINRVSPKKGRIVFFDGSIWHAGSKPAQSHRFVYNTNFIAHKY